jgi:hypothetical protein
MVADQNNLNVVATAHIEQHAVQQIDYEIKYDSEDHSGGHDPIEALGWLNEHDDEPDNA